MAQNVTADNSSLPSETPSLQFQCLKPMDVTILTMNTISFLINIFHLSVITRLESLKGTQYRTILINISLADMTNTLIVAIFNSCDDFFIYHFNYVAAEPALRIPINTLMLFANYIGYHVFMVASIQKYLAICKPISYQLSPFVKRLPVVFAIAWIYVLLLNLLFPVMEILAPVLWSQTEEIRMIQTVLLSIPPNLLTGVLLIKVYRAMKVRQHVRKAMMTTNAAQAKGDQGVMYLIIIFTLEMIVFALNTVVILIFYHTRITLWGKIWNGFVKAPYTVANTIIYGWRTKSYQIHVCRMFGCQTASVESCETP